MEENKNWSEVNDESKENLIEDLKATLENTLDQSKKILLNILKNLETTIKDEEIRKESKELIEAISNQLKNVISESQEKLGKILNPKNEEE